MCCNPDEFKIKLGLNLLGILLSNDLIPWTDALLEDFLNSLLKNTLQSYNGSIFKTSSHVLGMSLSALEKNNETRKVELIEEKLKETLKLWNHNKDYKFNNQFREVLYGLSRSYPKILKHFQTIIQSKIPSSTCIGKIKSIYLEMFLMSLDFYDEEDLYADISSVKIRKLLKSTDYQLLALHILNKSLTRMKRHDINSFIKDVENFCIKSRNVECRRLAYEFYMFIVTTYTEDTVDCQRNILKGFGDPDNSIQNRIFDFWNQQIGCYEATSQRLEQLILLGANTNCGKYFFSFCINMILSPALKQDDAVKNLLNFSNDDNENKLIEYFIDVNSKSRTSQSNRPYFAMDISSKHQTTRPNRQQFEFIRTTTGNANENVFTPTQDVELLSKPTQSFTMQNQTSMLFNVPIHILDNRSNISQTAIISGAEKFNKDDSLNYLRPRIIKQQNKEFQLVDYNKRTKSKKILKVSYFYLYDEDDFYNIS